MPAFCGVVGCANRHDRERDRSYYRLPKVILHQGERTKELSQDRREKWLANIARSDIKTTSYDNLRICSDHFINKPADLYDTVNPDWAPTLKMGHTSTLLSPPAGSKSRYDRSVERSDRKKKHQAATALLDLQVSENENAEKTELESGTATQTDMQQSLLSAMEAELARLQLENARLKVKVQSQSFEMSFFKESDEKVKYYTGLPNYQVLLALFQYVEPDIPFHHKSALSKFQQLIVTLMKLRLNSSNQDLADRFSVSDTTVSRTFLSMIDVLHSALTPLIHWPDRKELKKTMPMSFRTHFGTSVAVIIDCFELHIERPSNLKARGETWSSYKHSNTAKYLIGVTPQGVVSFISDGYGGRATDKLITENSGLLDKLLPGDAILADRGFDIRDSVGTVGASVYIPSFTKGKAQLGAVDIESTRKIANSRIHVERVIGQVRQKFSILSSKIPHDLLKGDDLVTLDKIVRVCCGLTNLCDSVVPFD